MKQTVRDWMISPVVIVPPEVSADQALGLMRDWGIRSVVVEIPTDGGRGYGIVTSTDVNDKIVSQDRNPSDIRAGEIMTAPIECAKVDWTLRQASDLMKKTGIHHLPVKDSHSALVGVISASDIELAAQGEERGFVS